MDLMLLSLGHLSVALPKATSLANSGEKTTQEIVRKGATAGQAELLR